MLCPFTNEEADQGELSGLQKVKMLNKGGRTRLKFQGSFQHVMLAKMLIYSLKV